MHTTHAVAPSVVCTALQAWFEDFIVHLPLRLTQPFNFCSGMDRIVFVRSIDKSIELAISSVTKRKKLGVVEERAGPNC